MRNSDRTRDEFRKRGGNEEEEGRKEALLVLSSKGSWPILNAVQSCRRPRKLIAVGSIRIEQWSKVDRLELGLELVEQRLSSGK